MKLTSDLLMVSVSKEKYSISIYIYTSPNFLKTYGDSQFISCSQEDTKSETFHSDLSGNSFDLERRQNVTTAFLQERHLLLN